MGRRLDDIPLACDALAFLLQGPEPLDVARKFSAQAHALWTRAGQCAPIGFRFLSQRQVSGDFNASTHWVDPFGSSCLKTGHDYGVQKDRRKHDFIEATPPSVSDRIECVVR